MGTPANALNISQTGLVNFDGNHTFTGVTITQHDVLVGGASNAIISVSPSTAGLVLTSNGVSADPSFQSISASGAITTITGNSGGALSPTAGNMNTLGTGSITIAGSGSTLTTQLTGLTNHNVLVGAGTATITNVSPSATAGIPLVSNGSSSDPSFTTAVVAGGGTGNTTFTAYSVVCAGTTATGAFQNVSGVGTSGQILTSNGASALPTWQAASASGAITTITGNSGGAQSPSAGNFNILGGTTGLTFTGTSATETLTGTLVLANGGTNASLTASNGGIFYSTASAGAILAGTATAGQIIRSGASSAPSWSTATYPATAGTSGNVLTSDGTNWVSSAPAASGTVTTVSVVTANGFAGTVANATTTPAITLTTSVTGLLNGNGTSVSAVTYSTGTWTPTIVGSGAAGSTTYVTQNGTYYRIGNMVTIQCNLSISAATGTGAALLGGLPFTPADLSAGPAYLDAAGWVWPVGTTSISVLVQPSGNHRIGCTGSATAEANMQMANAALQLVFSLTYPV